MLTEPHLQSYMLVGPQVDNIPLASLTLISGYIYNWYVH